MTPPDVWRELGDLVVKRRRQLGYMTQPAFAKAADVSLSSIGRLETGKPLSRRSNLWSKIERALEWDEGFIQRFIEGAPGQAGFVIRTSDLSELEPQARALIKGALMATLPDATVSQVLAAERAAIEALRAHGFLPPEE